MKNKIVVPVLGFYLIGSALAADSALKATAVAARLSAMQMGSSYVRLLMEIKGRQSSALQLQIKQRRNPAESDTLYQVLWPKERKGEAVLLHQDAGGPVTATVYSPPSAPRKLSPGESGQSLLGGGLSYDDAAENFFGWKNQAFAGADVVNGVNCVILESKPGSSDESIYGSVRTSIDAKRMVPMRVEKFLPSGRLARRIDTTRVANDDKGRAIPADLAVHEAGRDTETDLRGSRIRHDVTYSEDTFSVNSMKDVSPPPTGANNAQ